MGPLADFCCLSKKCQQDGAATTYFDLPVNSTRCPVCGSKRLKRLYNHAPGMIRSGGRHLQHVIDQAGSEAQLVKADRTDARLGAAKRQSPMLAVPMSQLGATLGNFGMRTAFASGESKPIPRPAHPAVAEVSKRTPIPASGSLRDTQHRIVNGKVVRT